MNRAEFFRSFKPYLAYCENTDEKRRLIRLIVNEFENEELRDILDLGCGNGEILRDLSFFFDHAHITGIEPSREQIRWVEKGHLDPSRVRLVNKYFESTRAFLYFDFILVSHVLQYVKTTDVSSFVEKAISYLRKGGEVWFVNQTKKGMAEIVEHQKEFLSDPMFQNWKTSEDFEPIILDCAKEHFVKRCTLDCRFRQIDFKNPSPDDKLRLEFIFGLGKDGFDKQSKEFKIHLGKLNLGDGKYISHPNEVVMVKNDRHNTKIIETRHQIFSK